MCDCAISRTVVAQCYKAPVHRLKSGIVAQEISEEEALCQNENWHEIGGKVAASNDGLGCKLGMKVRALSYQA